MSVYYFENSRLEIKKNFIYSVRHNNIINSMLYNRACYRQIYRINTQSAVYYCVTIIILMTRTCRRFCQTPVVLIPFAIM